MDGGGNWNLMSFPRAEGRGRNDALDRDLPALLTVNTVNMQQNSRTAEPHLLDFAYIV